jgi:uncharacterized membrane protein YfcA
MIEITLLIVGIIIAAFVMEAIDAGLGMMYGTILSPVLIIAGYSPFVVVPSIVLSQAIGGVFATVHHHKYKNATFSLRSQDLKIAGFIFTFGLAAVVIGAFVGSIISAFALKLYIAILCILMGIIVITKKKFKFSWKKISLIGLISSFNKALSGGGFGPIVATGNIASGLEAKKAIGITDFAEAPICFASFAAWYILSGYIMPDTNLLIPLCIGAAFGGLTGPYLLSRVKSKKFVTILVGLLAIISGIYILYNLI